MIFQAINLHLWRIFHGYVKLLSSKCVELETPPRTPLSAQGYLDKGQLIDDHRAIAKRYLKSWFMPDIVVTIIDVVAGPSIFVDVLSNTGWWFGTFFLFSHILGTIISID